jgi:hypothetical protein
MAKHEKVAVVIVNYNTKDLTLLAVDTLQSKGKTFDVYVVDNGSSELGLKEALSKRPCITYWSLPQNTGFGRGNNYALKKIYQRYEYVLLLNSDAQITSVALEELVAKAKLANATLASCYLTYLDGRFQPNAGSKPSPIHIFTWISGLDDIANLFGIHLGSYQEAKPWYYQNDREVGWVSGSVMLVETVSLAKIGFFDEDIFMYGEDVDLCLRTSKALRKIMWFASPKAIHIGGASSTNAKYKQWLGEFLGIEHLYRKHYGLVGLVYIKVLLYLFIPLRIVLFTLFGRIKYARNYLNIIKKV